MAHPVRPRRQHPIAVMNAAIAQRNGSWPSNGEMTSAGFASVAAAHQPRRRVGNAQNVAATVPTKPSTSHSVTTQSPRIGHSSPASIHGIEA